MKVALYWSQNPWEKTRVVASADPVLGVGMLGGESGYHVDPWSSLASQLSQSVSSKFWWRDPVSRNKERTLASTCTLANRHTYHVTTHTHTHGVCTHGGTNKNFRFTALLFWWQVEGDSAQSGTITSEPCRNLLSLITLPCLTLVCVPQPNTFQGTFINLVKYSSASPCVAWTTISAPRFLKFLLYLHIYLGEDCMHAVSHVWQSDNDLQELGLLPPCLYRGLNSGHPVWWRGFSGKYFYLLNHLTDS